MKRFFACMLPLAADLALLLAACEEEELESPNKVNVIDTNDYPPVENLDYYVIDDLDGNPGGGVYVFWNAPSGHVPDDYIVRVDGVDTEVMVTYYNAYEPAGQIDVYALYGSSLSEPRSLGFAAVETPYLDVWSSNDPSPDHPSGFGFNAEGTASSYGLSDPDNWSHLDYWIYGGYGYPMLVSPSDHVPPFNDEWNFAAEESANYDDFMTASPPGMGVYSTQRELHLNSLYSLWMDPDGLGYTEDDHFAKLHVTSIEEYGGIYKVTLKLAYQKTTGLRWLVTDKGHTGIEE